VRTCKGPTHFVRFPVQRPRLSSTALVRQKRQIRIHDFCTGVHTYGHRSRSELLNLDLSFVVLSRYEIFNHLFQWVVVSLTKLIQSKRDRLCVFAENANPHTHRFTIRFLSRSMEHAWNASMALSLLYSYARAMPAKPSTIDS
jgi:hypothetical protein